MTVVAAEGNDSDDTAHPTTDVTSPDDTTPIERAITNACVIVPVEVPGVIGVSAVGNFRQTDGDSDPNDYLKSFYSSFGVGVTDLTAPGGDSRFFTSEALPNGRVLSTWPSDLMADCLRPVVDPGHPLLQMENVIATPHSAGVTTGTSRRRAQALAENVDRLANGLPVLYEIKSFEKGEPQYATE